MKVKDWNKDTKKIQKIESENSIKTKKKKNRLKIEPKWKRERLKLNEKLRKNEGQKIKLKIYEH